MSLLVPSDGNSTDRSDGRMLECSGPILILSDGYVFEILEGRHRLSCETLLCLAAVC